MKSNDDGDDDVDAETTVSTLYKLSVCSPILA